MFLTILLAISHDGMRGNKIQVPFDLVVEILHIHVPGMTDNNLNNFLKLIKGLLVQTQELNKEFLNFNSFLFLEQNYFIVENYFVIPYRLFHTLYSRCCFPSMTQNIRSITPCSVVSFPGPLELSA